MSLHRKKTPLESTCRISMKSKKTNTIFNLNNAKKIKQTRHTGLFSSWPAHPTKNKTNSTDYTISQVSFRVSQIFKKQTWLIIPPRLFCCHFQPESFFVILFLSPFFCHCKNPLSLCPCPTPVTSNNLQAEINRLSLQFRSFFI